MQTKTELILSKLKNYDAAVYDEIHKESQKLKQDLATLQEKLSQSRDIALSSMPALGDQKLQNYHSLQFHQETVDYLKWNCILFTKVEKVKKSLSLNNSSELVHVLTDLQTEINKQPEKVINIALSKEVDQLSNLISKQYLENKKCLDSLNLKDVFQDIKNLCREHVLLNADYEIKTNAGGDKSDKELKDIQTLIKTIQLVDGLHPLTTQNSNYTSKLFDIFCVSLNAIFKDIVTEEAKGILSSSKVLIQHMTTMYNHLHSNLEKTWILTTMLWRNNNDSQGGGEGRFNTLLSYLFNSPDNTLPQGVPSQIFLNITKQQVQQLSTQILSVVDTCVSSVFKQYEKEKIGSLQKSMKLLEMTYNFFGSSVGPFYLQFYMNLNPQGKTTVREWMYSLLQEKSLKAIASHLIMAIKGATQSEITRNFEISLWSQDNMQTQAWIEFFHEFSILFLAGSQNEALLPFLETSIDTGEKHKSALQKISQYLKNLEVDDKLPNNFISHLGYHMYPPEVIQTLVSKIEKVLSSNTSSISRENKLLKNLV